MFVDELFSTQLKRDDDEMTIRSINDNRDYKCTYATAVVLIEKHYCSLELLELLLGILLL